ncbi:MAG: murein biosynthesis integral membrane protein MurJ [Chloroflexota bacterium]|nr:murein biosynthesis integral membrane protein MurJ [Chloroflexota bacterium]
MEKNQREVTRATLLVMAAFAFSRALGLVRQIVFSRYFGTGPEMDAYVAAMRIPDMLFLVVAGGALGSAFIPVFTARLTRGERTEAWGLASAIINLLLLVIIPLSLGAMLLAPWLVRHLIAPALSPAIQARTVILMRVMLLSPAIFGVSGVVMGILNAHRHFLLPALAPLLYNLAIIAGALWGGNTRWGTLGPAIGMVIGALLHLGVQVPGLLRFSARYTPTLGLEDAAVRNVGRLMVPRVLGVAVVQLNMVITTALASTLGSGAISALDYAWRLMLLPQGVFAQAVGTAVFPTLSAQAARGELDELRRTLTTMIRTLIAIVLPATAGLIVLGQPLIALVFERGAFSTTSTHEVSVALALFALGLLGHSLIEILARAFYALQDTWSPAGAAGGAMVINLILGLLLPALFAQAGWLPLGGLALANALAALLEMVVLFLLMERQLDGMPNRELLHWSLRPLGATLGMSAVLLLWLHIAPESHLILSIGGVLLGLASYLCCAWLLQMEELLTILAELLKQVPTRS